MRNYKKMKEPTETDILLSIRMITYNHGKYLRQALDSILMQKVDFEYEVIVGEDCSPDDTRQIVIEYAEKYPDRIKPILQKRNKGPNENAKDVTRRCRGKYIAFLEGDDYWTDPDKLRIQIDYMEHHPEVSLTYHKVNVINEKNEIINHERIQKQYDIFDHSQLFEEGMLPTCSMIIKNFFSDNDYLKYFKSKYIGDLIIFSLSLKHGDIHYIDRNMGVYRFIRDEGTSYSALSQTLRMKYLLIAYISIAEIIDNSYKEIFIEKKVIYFILSLYYKGQRKEVFQIYVKYLNLSEKMKVFVYLINIFRLMNRDKNPTKRDEQAYFGLMNAINLKMMEDMIKSDDRVIIYGTKDWGRKLYHVLSMKRMNILAFSDSKEEMWEKCMYGVRVISPMEIKNTNYTRIFIASSAYAEIRESLRHRGIDEKKIIFFEFMREEGHK